MRTEPHEQPRIVPGGYFEHPVTGHRYMAETLRNGRIYYTNEIGIKGSIDETRAIWLPHPRDYEQMKRDIKMASLSSGKTPRRSHYYIAG